MSTNDVELRATANSLRFFPITPTEEYFLSLPKSVLMDTWTWLIKAVSGSMDPSEIKDAELAKTVFQVYNHYQLTPEYYDYDALKAYLTQILLEYEEPA